MARWEGGGAWGEESEGVVGEDTVAVAIDLVIVSDETGRFGGAYCGIRDCWGKEVVGFAARMLASSWADAVEG